MTIVRALALVALAFGIIVAPLAEAQQGEGPTWN